MTPIRYMIVDDQQIIREGLAGMLRRESDLLLVGTAEDGAEAVLKAHDMQPDIILMDLRMPRMDGVEAIKRIRKVCPHTKFIVLTVYDNDDFIFEAIRAGAKAYLMKDISREELIRVIHAVADGQAYLQPEITSRLLDRVSEMPLPEESRSFSKREVEILQLLAQGLSNKEIAHQLTLSEHTVKTHVANIFTKLEVNNRAEAVLQAVKKGILQA
ncbi:MAG: response regulator transcription factor [Anaerolineales bacterium]